MEALRESRKKKRGGGEVMNCETKMQTGVIMEAVEEWGKKAKRRIEDVFRPR